jgi:hypothetical protein
MDTEMRRGDAAKAWPEDRDAGVESTRDWLQGRISGGLAAGIGIAWLLAYQLAVSLEPVTHRPEPWFGVLLGVAFFALLATMATGLVMQRRWGLVVSVVAAAFFTALSVACPVSGHHPFGAWWFGQMACALGMLGGSVAAVSWSTRTDGADPFDPHGPSDPSHLSAGDAASRG